MWIRGGDQVQVHQHHSRCFLSRSEAIGGNSQGRHMESRPPARTQTSLNTRPAFGCMGLVPRVAGGEPVIEEISFSLFEICF